MLGQLRIGGVQPRITPRDRVVLAALCIRVGDNVTADWLADALWGETPPASAAKNLQGCIARLRKVLGPDAIETTATGYRLALSPEDVDSHAFEHLVHRARELLALREPDRAAYVLDEALELFSGEPLEDLAAGTRECSRPIVCARSVLAPKSCASTPSSHPGSMMRHCHGRAPC